MELNNSQVTDNASYFTSLSILHIAFLVGQLIFAGVASFLVFSNAVPPSLEDSVALQVAAILLAIGGLVAGQMLYNKRVNEAQAAQTTDEKLATFRAVFIMKDALLEGPSIFALVIFLLTGKMLYLCVSGALILWFALQYPYRSKVLSELSLDELALTDGKTDRF
jgi:hypothetical protein